MAGESLKKCLPISDNMQAALSTHVTVNSYAMSSIHLICALDDCELVKTFLHVAPKKKAEGMLEVCLTHVAPDTNFSMMDLGASMTLNAVHCQGTCYKTQCNHFEETFIFPPMQSASNKCAYEYTLVMTPAMPMKQCHGVLIHWTLAGSVPIIQHSDGMKWHSCHQGCGSKKHTDAMDVSDNDNPLLDEVNMAVVTFDIYIPVSITELQTIQIMTALLLQQQKPLWLSPSLQPLVQTSMEPHVTGLTLKPPEMSCHSMCSRNCFQTAKMWTAWSPW